MRFSVFLWRSYELIIISYNALSLLHLSILNSFSMSSVWLSISAMVASMYFLTSSILSDSLAILFTITIGNVQFLDVFCIFEYQENKQFFRFLGTGSKALLFRDGAVRPLRKDNILHWIPRKSCGSGINIVLDKSDRHANFGYFFILSKTEYVFMTHNLYFSNFLFALVNFGAEPR